MKLRKDVTMTFKTSADATARPESNLDDRYGKIGIPAVAAAIAYQSDAKNSAYAPVESFADRWLAERDAA
jgi:hypothetical protein